MITPMLWFGYAPYLCSLVYGSLGRAIAARASATSQHLSRSMRPCMDSFPGEPDVPPAAGGCRAVR